MKEKYKQRIRQFAEQSLENQLEQKILPYMDSIPPEIREVIKSEVLNTPLPEEESLGTAQGLDSQLQSEGRAIADKLINGIFEQTIPYIKQEKRDRKTKLEKDRLLTAQSGDSIRELKDKIENGAIGQSGLWRGADVMIVPKHVPEEELVWTHTNDTQVVTGNEQLARSISWLFVQLRDIMRPFLDFRNKYEFYGGLADAANEVIKSGNAYDEKDVLNSVLSRGERFQTEWLPKLNEYLDKEENDLKERES